MTPNAGMLPSFLSVSEGDVNTDNSPGFGGNQAIESAAALANSIKKLSESSNGQRPTQDQVVACLRSYQKSREVRAAAAIQASNFLTHVQALATWGHALFARYGLNYMGDFLENLTSDVTVGAVAINHLPLPEGSLHGWMPFNPEQGQGMKENLFVRAALAMPFLLVFAFVWTIMSPAVGVSADGLASSAWYSARLMPSSSTGTPWSFGGQSNRHVSMLQIPSLRLTLLSSATMNNTHTTSSTVHPAPNMLTTNFLSFYGVILSIWSIEAIRCCNALMPVQLYVYPTQCFPLTSKILKSITDNLQTHPLRPPRSTKRSRCRRTSILLHALGAHSHRYFQVH